MRVDLQKFFDDYQNLLYDKEVKVQEIEGKETEKIKAFLTNNNYPLSILPDFIEKVKQESLGEIESKIKFYENYIIIDG